MEQYKDLSAVVWTSKNQFLVGCFIFFALFLWVFFSQIFCGWLESKIGKLCKA